MSNFKQKIRAHREYRQFERALRTASPAMQQRADGAGGSPELQPLIPRLGDRIARAHGPLPAAGERAVVDSGRQRPGPGISVGVRWFASAVTTRQIVKVRAPEFPVGTWFNTADPLSLRELRGKIVLLDFWTFCCANCLHVIDELRELEQAYPDELVIIGVHSPKFEHEKSDRAVAAAIERYGVAHPVFNDPELHLWQQYAVRAWPTLMLIDPDGYLVAQAAGEGQASGLRLLIDELVEQYGDALRRGDHPYRPPAAEPGSFRFPAKAIRHNDVLLVADAGHHQIVETELDGARVRRRFGTGHRGHGAGEFAEPNGLTAVPAELVDRLGFDVLVADTGNHRLAGLRTSDGTVPRLVDLAAGLAGVQTVTGPVPGVLSPWDVAWWPARGLFAIAAAGVHLLLGWDPIADRVSILAGTTVEGLRDGDAAEGWLAQPSGLAVDGDRLWFADSETSALRYLTARRPAAHRDRRGLVRLRPRGRPGRAGPAAASARRAGAGRLLDRHRRHLQLGAAPLLARHRRGEHAGGQSSPNRPACSRWTASCWWSSRPRTGWSGRSPPASCARCWVSRCAPGDRSPASGRAAYG